jgi:ParB-like chromosome segregation protein Spo0J
LTIKNDYNRRYSKLKYKEIAMGIKELSKEFGKKDIYRIDPRSISVIAGWNVRQPGPEKDAHVRFLADSIKEVGVKIPLTIRMENDQPVIVDGECRWLGTMLAISEGADIKSIPVMMEDRYASNEDRVMTMLTCNGGKPLTLPEKAEAYKRLLGWGWDEAKIAVKNGVTIQAVKSALNFSALNPELKKMVSDGQVSATLVTQVVAEKGQEAALETISAASNSQSRGEKKKVTKRHLERSEGISEKKINWNTWGPKLKAMLDEICSVPINDKTRVQEAIIKGGELLQQIDG